MVQIVDKKSTGYKETDIGLLPVDWSVVALKECLSNPPDYGINAPATKYSESLPIYLRITDISEDGRFLTDKKASVNKIGMEKYFLNEDDLVFARTGASTGKTYLYNHKDGQMVFAGFLIRVKTDSNKLQASYLKHYTNTSGYWRWVQVMSMRSGQPGINGNEYAQLPLPVPKVAEQKAIATALSNIDALIENLEKLIAKKRAIKRAAMQQLLTGKIRLPGFKDEWATEAIGNLTYCTAGGTPSTKTPHYWGGNIRWMNSGELNLKWVHEVEGRITEDGLNNSSTRLIPKKCVLVGLAGQGKTRGTVAINYVELCTNQSIAAIYPSNKFVSEFIYYNLDNRYQELRDLSSGDTGRGGLNLTLIKSISILLPSIPEQKAISAALLNIDQELNALSSKHHKYRNIKIGMMQQLLTGKKRIYEPGK